LFVRSGVEAARLALTVGTLPAKADFRQYDFTHARSLIYG
jgi:hypothetical protein